MFQGFCAKHNNPSFQKEVANEKNNVLISSCQSQHTFLHSFDKSSGIPSVAQLHLYFL